MTETTFAKPMVKHRRTPGIRGRLMVAFGGVFAVLLVIYLVAITMFGQNMRMSEQAATDDLDSIAAAQDMHEAVDQIAEAAGQLRREGSPLDAGAMDSSIAEFNRAMSLQVQRVTLPGEEELTHDIQGDWGRIQEAAGAVRSAGDVDAGATIVRDRLMPAVREIRPRIARLAQMNAAGIKSRNTELRQRTGTSVRMLHIILALGFLTAISFALLMARRLIGSLAAMTDSAKGIARGDLGHELAVNSRDELGELAATFNEMIRELRRLRAIDADRLQRAYQTSQTAIDSLPDGVVMFEDPRRVELANQTARRLFGIDVGENELPSRLPWLEAVLGRDGETPESYQTSIEVKDGGSSRYFLPRSVRLINPEGRKIGWTLILVDVTAFRKLDQFKDSLLSMASHELRTPLTSMRMILPLLLEQSLGPLNAKQAELLSVTRESTERMRRIVDTILDLGRLAGGKMPLSLRNARPRDLAAKSMTAIRQAYTGKGVGLKFGDVDDSLGAVRCDPNLIEHVFSNLLSNALRHTPADGVVTVSAHGCGESVRLEVGDTGSGIAPAHLSRVFETFYRVPGQRSDTGSGLGLSLVKQIVESHGGQVGVESVVNRGSTFWFTLPLARTGGEADSHGNGFGDENGRDGGLRGKGGVLAGGGAGSARV